MASPSQAATCNGGDVSCTVDEDEEAMWNRLLQADRVARTHPTKEKVIKAASFSKDDIAEFKNVDFVLLHALLSSFEGGKVAKSLSGPQICIILSILHVSDIQRKWESRFLKLFWRYSHGISDADLLLLLSKVADHYSPSHEVENLEEFVLTNEERTTFLNDCSTLDQATRVAEDFNDFSLRQTQVQSPKPEYWTSRDHILHSMSSFSESVKPLELIFPFSTRFETAKECLARLDLLKSVTVDLNPDESDTLASVLSTFKSPEFQALHALKKEMELHREVSLQLEQLRGKHLLAYEKLRIDQHERLDEFFRTCQDESRNVVQEALYKKVKCLASIKKANINRQVKLSFKDLMKRILQKAGSALKEVEGKLKKAQSSDSEGNKECTLCYSEFSKKRKRACLDPCGHASACIDCATEAWVKKPYCPWCKARIQKPISIPAQIFL